MILGGVPAGTADSKMSLQPVDPRAEQHTSWVYRPRLQISVFGSRISAQC